MGSGCVLRTSITFQRRVWECATARYINLWPKFKQKRGKYGNSMVNPVDSHPMEYFTLGGKEFSCFASCFVCQQRNNRALINLILFVGKY